MLTTDTVGGVWQYTMQLARGLAKYGVEITLVSVGRAPSYSQSEEIGQLTNLRRHVNLPYKLEWERDSLGDIADVRGALSDLIYDTYPDLLHSGQFCFGDLPTPCPRLVVAHSDIFSWQRWCSDPTAPLDPDWHSFTLDYHRLVQCGLHGADAVIAPSQFMADSLSHDYNLPASRIQVIHNGVSISSPRFGIKEPLAVTVGRLWDKAKNVKLVAEAVTQARREGDDFMKVVLAGEDTPAGSIYHVDAGIEYVGHLAAAQLYSLFARAGLYIAASCYEPFGLAAVEAALHGCAILANDIPTFHEVWGDDAIYFQRNDAASLRAALGDLLTDPTLSAGYGARAHLRALNLYSAPRMAAAYYQLYQQLLPTDLWYNQGAELDYHKVEAHLGY